MKIVSGSLNDDWYFLSPGDMIVSSNPLRLSWPPDGMRSRRPNSALLWDPIISTGVGVGEPLYLVAHKRREGKGMFTWYRNTWSIVFYNERLWWVGTSASGSIVPKEIIHYE